ncbi:MAG: hypothetical protein ACK4UJ_04805 [Leptonema sp. (in: bacteria)]
MLNITRYELKSKYKVCVNILPNFHKELLRLSRGKLNHFLEYLYNTYKRKLLQMKIAPIKGTATTEYQPDHEEYKQIVLYGISPNLWRRYKDLREMTGYSVSFILRVFIEWELMREGIPLTPLLPRDEDSAEGVAGYSEQNCPLAHNYVIRSQWNRQKNQIKILFWDDC